MVGEGKNNNSFITVFSLHSCGSMAAETFYNFFFSGAFLYNANTLPLP